VRRNDIEEEGDANIIITRIIENKNPFNLYITTNIYIHQNHHHHLMNARARARARARASSFSSDCSLCIQPHYFRTAVLLEELRPSRVLKSRSTLKAISGCNERPHHQHHHHRRRRHHFYSHSSRFEQTSPPHQN